MSGSDVMRAASRVLTELELKAVAEIKALAESLHAKFDAAAGREIALAKTKLEEAVMWAVKGITG